jgi:hypothetical protein
MQDFEANLSRALERAEEFEVALCSPIASHAQLPLEEVGRTELTFAALLLAREHAAVLRSALGGNAPVTAAALLRLQLEALVRAAWLLYAANDLHIEKLAQPISDESEQAAKNIPGSQEMLASLAARAPIGLVGPLVEMNDSIRHPLNSYVHAGLHPIRRRLAGFPKDLVFLLLRNSNGLLLETYRVMALLHSSQPLMDTVTAVHLQFRDCLNSTDTQTTSSSAA